MSNEGKKVKVHYTGTLDDGEKFDSSLDRGEPLAFTCMAGQMIPGFDKAVRDMQVGETVKIRLEPADAYGERNPDAVQTVPKAQIGNLDGFQPGDTVMLQTRDGRPVQAVLAARDDKTVTFDFNHPMAGKALNFEIELLEAK